MVGLAAGHPAAGPAAALSERITSLQKATRAPVLVALNGRSGAGKSTVVALVGAQVGALVIDGDDFYRGGTDDYWDALGPAEKVDLVIDWERSGPCSSNCGQAGPPRGSPMTGTRTTDDGRRTTGDGRLGAPVTAGPAAVDLLNGAYSARPELSDLYGQWVLLTVPRAVRRERLLRREGERYRAEWEARWGEAGDLSFDVLMSRPVFDLVLDGT